MKQSAEIEDILEANKTMFKLSEDCAVQLLSAVTDFLAFQTSLRNHFGNSRQLFHITIKSHYLLHIAIIGHYMNPRIGWCYSGEDMMGLFKKVIANSQRGVPMSQLSDRSMMKYSYGMTIKFSKERE